MFDTNQPTLVFDTHTLHPVLDTPTGFIFKLVDYHFDEPRELFFEDIFAAQVFAMQAKALFVMDPKAMPGRMTAADFDSAQDETLYLYAVRQDTKQTNPLLSREHLSADQGLHQILEPEGFYETELEVD